MRIVHKLLNIFLLILLLSILINPAYSKPVLRLPINTDETQIRINSVLDEDVRFMFKGSSSDRIIVFRNNVRGKPKGQVEMRVCEISELSNEERLGLIEAFDRWLTDYPGMDRDGVIHGVTIKSILNLLRRSDSPLKESSELTRVYIAISYPKQNGRNGIDVEGFVVTELRVRP